MAETRGVRRSETVRRVDETPDLHLAPAANDATDYAQRETINDGAPGKYTYSCADTANSGLYSDTKHS